MSYRSYEVDEIIRYAREHSPYYRNLYRNLPAKVSLEDLPVIDQKDFWEHCDARGGDVATGEQMDGQVLKSGGTTGNPKYSLYSAEEWHAMCEASALVLPRGGLRRGERIANMFYAGGMYASFLYMYSMCCLSPAKPIVYNLSGNSDVSELAETIREHRITTLAGLPSLLMRLIACIGEGHAEEYAVDTVYFAGETMFEDQKEKLRRTFGRELSFRSVFYASNDGGPIGYFAKDCGFNEHRVLSDLTYVELIDPDTGEVISDMNRRGLIVITSRFKTLIPLIRYPAGDYGEWTEPEGNPDRRFRLLSRTNIAARAGYVTLYPQDVAEVLKECGLTYFAYQIIVRRRERDRFVFLIAVGEGSRKMSKEGTGADTGRFLQALYRKRTLLADALADGTLDEPEVVWCSPQELIYNKRTGKLKTVIDERFKGQSS